MSNDKKAPKKPERKSIDEEIKKRKQWPPLEEPEKKPEPKPKRNSSDN